MAERVPGEVWAEPEVRQELMEALAVLPAAGVEEEVGAAPSATEALAGPDIIH